jgi:predicted nucleic acid-binding protein
MREIVLDTNVLVSAFRSKRGASYELVRSIGLGGWRLNISVALALEYEDVLKRKGMLPHGITEAEVDAFLDYVFRTANLVPFVLRRRPSLRDQDDERILEVAAQCRAIIITHNRRDFVGAERFGVQVRTPAEFLQMLRKSDER